MLEDVLWIIPRVCRKLDESYFWAIVILQYLSFCPWRGTFFKCVRQIFMLIAINLSSQSHYADFVSKFPSEIVAVINSLCHCWSCQMYLRTIKSAWTVWCLKLWQNIKIMLFLTYMPWNNFLQISNQNDEHSSGVCQSVWSSGGHLIETWHLIFYRTILLECRHLLQTLIVCSRSWWEATCQMHFSNAWKCMLCSNH